MGLLGGLLHGRDTTSALVQVSRIARVERGPMRKQVVATQEFLDDPQTASHYKERMIDAAGQKIIHGQAMEFLDWKGQWVWWVYRFQEGKWMPMGFKENRVDAVEWAKTL